MDCRWAEARWLRSRCDPARYCKGSACAGCACTGLKDTGVGAEVPGSMALTGKESGVGLELPLLPPPLLPLLWAAAAVEESGDTLRQVGETLPGLPSSR